MEVLDVLIGSVQCTLPSWTDSYSSNNLRTRTQNIIHKLSDGCVVSVQALDSTHISYVEGEVRAISWLVGYPWACLSLHLLLTVGVYLPTHLHLILIFLLCFPFYLLSDGENLRIHLGLLRYKKHLDLYFQALQKSTCSVLLVSHHVRRKLTMS